VQPSYLSVLSRSAGRGRTERAQAAVSLPRMLGSGDESKSARSDDMSVLSNNCAKREQARWD
jgi:hypothetical protein